MIGIGLGMIGTGMAILIISFMAIMLFSTVEPSQSEEYIFAQNVIYVICILGFALLPAGMVIISASPEEEEKKWE